MNWLISIFAGMIGAVLIVMVGWFIMSKEYYDEGPE